ncbi:MAG: hypothetical protein V1691_00415 [Chloroflexota bacterium]
MKRASITEELAYGSALDRLTGADRAAPAAADQPEKKQPETAVAMIKLSVFLNRDEDAFLERLGATAKFSGGRKLSKTKIVEAMVRAFSNSGLDVRGVRTDEELLQRVNAQLR